MNALEMLGWVLLYLYVFWLCYVLVMSFYRAHLLGKLTGVTKWVAAPVVGVGVLLDVAAQYTLASMVFIEPPHRSEHLVTQRLQRHINSGAGWRFRVATWVCTHLLDVFDPSGKHC